MQSNLCALLNAIHCGDRVAIDEMLSALMESNKRGEALPAVEKIHSFDGFYQVWPSRIARPGSRIVNPANVEIVASQAQERVMKFEIANNCIFRSRENHVMRSSDRICPDAWIFDCEDQAACAADKRNKTETKHGRINAVACIID